MPLFISGPIPEWMLNAGCKVVAWREVINYLGCPIGYGVTPTQEADFLLGKVRKRLGHWANRMLSWNGKVVLLKHVLRTIPGYHLMALSLNNQGYKQLEKTCHIFLWGMNEQGKPKKALIVWEEITRPRAEGGLDIRPFAE